MRQSRSIQKSRRNNSATPSKSQQGRKNNGESQFYYCHFQNAIYMGGIKSFQKHGRGIMIYDDGTCAVTSYVNDFKNGHNIYYRENCILSIEYQKNKINEIVIRIKTFLLFLRVGKDQKLEGKSLLLDFNHRQIFYVLYCKGIITQKHQQHDLAILNKIFDLENLQYFIGQNHSAAIKFQIERDHNIASQRVAAKFQAGFYKKGFLNGLGFNLIVKDPHLNSQYTKKSNELFVQLLDRGYYNNSSLHGIGEQKFKNGNSYWGNFKAGSFDGLGILKNQIKNNWVYGQFESGNLCQLLQYSHDGEFSRISKLMSSLHERKNNWINKQIESPSFQEYIGQIENILACNLTQKMRDLKNKKLEVLKKIQDNFLCQNEKNTEMDENNQENDSKMSNLKTDRDEERNIRLKQSKKSPQTVRYQTGAKYASDQKNSRFKTELTDPITTKGSSARVKQSGFKNYLQVPSLNSGNPNQVKRDTSRSPFKRGINHQQQLSFALDSKRMIGRSKIFKQFSSDEQQLPKFNYGQT